MTAPETPESTTADPPIDPMAILQDMQHWTAVIGRAQQMLLSHATETATDGQALAESQALIGQMMTRMMTPKAIDPAQMFTDPAAFMQAQADFLTHAAKMWTDMASGQMTMLTPQVASDKRFRHSLWDEHPLFNGMRTAYLFLAEQMMAYCDRVDGIAPDEKERLRFTMRGVVDALAPTNFVLTNPAVIERAVETRGESLLKGLEHMLADLKKGQMTQVDDSGFELGVNIAATPGKVVYRAPLFELIHYTPTTESVLKTPLVIFPPWINRFYILDLTAKKSFVQWAVDQGISTFMVSWKSADASMADVTWDDYIAAEIDAVEQIRTLLNVPSVHTIGYCVAGTTLAATLAYLHARGEADTIASATFFTAQVDFTEAGDLKCMLSDEHRALIEAVSHQGYLDGRYMAATFNALRGNDLIWSYVVNNYMLGEPYQPFDLLYWNGDTTNLPAHWHHDYLDRLYRQNLLVQPGAISVLGQPIDINRITTPAYIQAAREDHIAPAVSVWKLMHHLNGPKTFTLAGSGHIAGVVNPPANNKYQYWTCDTPVDTLDDYIANATEIPGSWWPHWADWLRQQAPKTVKVKGARTPGGGDVPALEDAPGSYVRMR